jgi:hypothetical protein
MLAPRQPAGRKPKRREAKRQLVWPQQVLQALGLVHMVPRVLPAGRLLCARRVRGIVGDVLGGVGGGLFDSGELAGGEGGELSLDLAHLP